MRIRDKILPQTPTDIGSFLLIAICIPCTYFFEVFIVLPEFHEIGSLSYILSVALATFLVFNIKTNMIAVMMIDTSIKHQVLNPPEDPQQRKLWRMCVVCETLCPPRSWHCNVCRTCILKRDHHCMFTGCCIGHRNHRFFIIFLLYFFIGTLYTTIYNSIYLWHLRADVFLNPMTIAKMFLPMFMVMVDSGNDTNQYMLIYILNTVGLLYSLVLLIMHTKIVINGAVGWEVSQKIKSYNLGMRHNIEMVFGKRMYLVLLAPFIKSELPSDGIHWEEIYENSIKVR